MSKPLVESSTLSPATLLHYEGSRTTFEKLDARCSPEHRGRCSARTRSTPTASSSLHAADMKKLADDKSQAFKRAEPGENDNPGPENSSTKLAALDKLDPTAYRGRQMFSESEFLDVKRRPPAILTVDDAKVSLARVAVKSYMFNKDGKSLTVIKGGATAMAGGGAAGIPSGKGNAVQAKDQAIRLFAAKKNAPKATSEGTKYSDRLIAYLKNLEFSGRKMAETLTVTSDEYEKMKGSYRPAEQALPLRMAIVNASFPYKAQMEEFRNKLKLGSFAEVLNDATASPEDPNVGVNAFRFLGILFSLFGMITYLTFYKGKGRPVEWET